jgi:hypothetical protein
MRQTFGMSATCPGEYQSLVHSQTSPIQEPPTVTLCTGRFFNAMLVGPHMEGVTGNLDHAVV